MSNMPSKHEKDTVVQSNDLVEAIYDSDMTVTEHKILRYAASKVRRDNTFPEVSFTVAEFLKSANLKGNAYHTKIEALGDQLIKKSIKVKTDDEIDWMTWISKMKYKDGMVSIIFNMFIKDYLIALDREFTKYDFDYIGDMRSSYSIRLYELLKQYAPIGKRTLKISEIKELLGITEKYKQYASFKRSVIEVAQKELEKKKELTFTFEEIKKGRKVVALKFIIQENSPSSDIPSQQQIGNKSAFVNQAKVLLDSYAISIPEKQIAKWEKYGINLLAEVLEEVDLSNIDKPFPYLFAVLKDKSSKDSIQSAKTGITNPEISKLLHEFINHYNIKNNERMLDVILKLQFDKKFRDVITPKEIDELWNEQKEYIAKKTGQIIGS